MPLNCPTCSLVQSHPGSYTALFWRASSRVPVKVRREQRKHALGAALTALRREVAPASRVVSLA
eukprot:200453-Pelagomonas_calceolata.AAC.11